MIEVRVRLKTENCYGMMREAILDSVEEGLIEHGWSAEIVRAGEEDTQEGGEE